MHGVVCGSALVAGMSIDNYVLMQAAVPAGCYDESGGKSTGGVNGYARFWNAEATEPTPDLANPDRGYRGHLTSVSGNLVNFHNSLDFALATGTTLGLETNWEANQEDFKPDKAPINTWYYNYNPNDPILDQRAYITWSAGGARFSIDHHEVMSFVARPRSKAVR